MWRLRSCGSRTCLQLRKKFSTAPDTSSASSGSGKWFGKALLYGVAGTGLAGASVTGYAYYDPEFRKRQEESYPYLQPAFSRILGEPRDVSQPMLNISDIKEKISNYLPPWGKALPPADEKTATTTISPPFPPSGKEISGTPTAKQSKDEELRRSIVKEDEEKKKANLQLEKNVELAVISAERSVRIAVESKNASATAVEHRTNLLRKAMEDPKDPHWQSVEKASKSVEYSLNEDANREKGARNELEKLRKTINEGRSGKLTADNPILVNANETLNKMVYDIDDAIAKVRQAQTESKIMTEFKSLVEEGREQFSKELKSIRPNADIYAKGAKLTEDELNSLIAHAHVRVDQLRRQLAEQQLREHQHIEQALERQKAELNKSAEERLELELRKAYSDSNTAVEQKLQEAKNQFEDELRAQLRRSAAAHSDHLEEVLRVQKDQMEVESSRKVDMAVQKERERFHEEVASSLSRLQGIENALDSRATQDIENRKAKELCPQNLCESVVHGRKSGYDIETRRKPLANELMAIKETCRGDPFVNMMVKAFPDEALEAGVYTEEDLKGRFRKSFLIFDVYKKFSKDEEMDPNDTDTFNILSRANYFIFQDDDFTTAIRYMLLLRGEPARVARDWIRDTRIHLETRQTAELLLAHAAATSVRTLY